LKRTNKFAKKEIAATTLTISRLINPGKSGSDAIIIAGINVTRKAIRETPATTTLALMLKEDMNIKS
jgi:hypothetical protein